MLRPPARLRFVLLAAAASILAAAPSHAQWTVNGFDITNYYVKDLASDGGTGVVALGQRLARLDTAGVKQWGPVFTGQGSAGLPEAVAGDALGFFTVYLGSATIAASKVNASGASIEQHRQIELCPPAA
jgi:hypothetical protein